MMENIKHETPTLSITAGDEFLLWPLVSSNCLTFYKMVINKGFISCISWTPQGSEARSEAMNKPCIEVLFV